MCVASDIALHVNFRSHGRSQVKNFTEANILPRLSMLSNVVNVDLTSYHSRPKCGPCYTFARTKFHAFGKTCSFRANVPTTQMILPLLTTTRESRDTEGGEPRS